jgi:hypothetical protein
LGSILGLKPGVILNISYPCSEEQGNYEKLFELLTLKTVSQINQALPHYSKSTIAPAFRLINKKAPSKQEA